MDEGFDKPKLRAARTTFLDNILQRSGTSKVQSARDEEIAPRHPFYIHPEATAGMTPSIKRLKLFGSKSDDEEEEANMSGPTRHKVPLLIRFYDPEIRGKDAVGRTLDEILAWEDSRLETCHNYIQMLFPLPEGSIFNMQAPIITREVMEAFRERDELKGRLRESFQRILKFYGFKIKVDGEEDEDEDRETDEENGDEAEQLRDPEQVEGEPQTSNLQETASQPIDGQTETIGPTEVTEEPRTTASLEEAEPQAQNAVDTIKVAQEEEMGSDSKQIPKETEGIHTADETENAQTTNETETALPANETNNSHTAETNSDQAMTEPSEQPACTGQVTSITQEDNPHPIESPHTESKALKTKPTSSTIQSQPHYHSLLPPHGCIIVRGANWRRAFRNWAIRFDHNHLRMTRILRSLRVLGLQDECDAFYDALKEVFNDERIYINERTMMYWRQAVRSPLHIAPDGEQVPWLKKWAKKAA